VWSVLEDTPPQVAKYLNQTFQTVFMRHGAFLLAEGHHFDYLL
jgi:hypothetical protein